MYIKPRNAVFNEINFVKNFYKHDLQLVIQ